MTMQVRDLIISNTMRVSNHRAVHMINTAKRKTTVFFSANLSVGKELSRPGEIDRHRG